jgi:TatD DNase family protein
MDISEPKIPPGTKFVDVHAHISDKAFDGSRGELLGRLKDTAILDSGEDAEEDEKVLENGNKFVNLRPCIGLHPNKLVGLGSEAVEKELSYLEDNISKAFAVSEIGLDFRNKDETQISTQIAVLEKILELAEKNRKVCILHSRKSISELIPILMSSFKVRAVIHNFEGGVIQYRKAVEGGVYISISTGFMRYKKDNLIKQLDPHMMFVETDSPVLSPDENMNTPLNIPKLLNYISLLINMNESDLRETMLDNFKRVFYG